MRRGRIGVAALIAFSCMLAPSSAVAAEPASFGAAFRLDGSNGYRIFGYAYSERIDGRGGVSLFVSRPGASATYFAPARVTADVIEADLGSLGRIDLVLHRSGREKTVRAKCGRPVTYEPGTYEGIFEFNGEEGYTQVEEARVPLLVLPLLEVVCGGSGSGEAGGPGLPGARLRGFSFAHGRKLEFQINKNRPRAKTLYSVSIRERHEGVLISRAVEGWAPAAAFEFEPDLSIAELRLPAPFSGYGVFRRVREFFVGRWSGDLAVDLPGRSNVKLAAHGSHASLIHAKFSRDSSISFADPFAAPLAP